MACNYDNWQNLAGLDHQETHKMAFFKLYISGTSQSIFRIKQLQIFKIKKHQCMFHYHKQSIVKQMLPKKLVKDI